MNQSLLHELHAERGASLLPGDEPRPLLTYGDVPGEYAAATTDWVVFDETDRGAVSVAGEEASAFLHRLLANEVRDLPVGACAPNLLLDPKGKIRFPFDLERRGEGEFRLSTEPGQAEALVEALDTFLFAEAVELLETTGEHAPITVAGPRAGEELAGLTGDPPPTESSARVTIGEVEALLQPTIRAGLPAWRLDSGPEGAAILWETLVEAGARPTGRVVWDSLRAEVGVAQPGEDIDETIYPQEARLESAFSLEKGCYIGQEVVAKIDTYGGLNKRLCLLRVDHDDPVARGTRLHRQDPDSEEWRDLGVATTWAYSFALDCGVVLAFVKRKHQEPGTEFRLGDGPGRATLVELPVRSA